MMKKILIYFILVACALPAHAEVKKADLAGAWYSDSAEALRDELQTYLDAAAGTAKANGRIIALISPHAGFRYSGSVAAHGFNAIMGKGIRTVVIVGFSHRKQHDGIAVLDVNGFETPLGVVDIDREITKALLKKDSKFYRLPEAFSGENSVEMQIPFLQMALDDFKIVPVAIGNQGFENCEMLGKALYELLKDKSGWLLVASTDMSHYLPYEEANKMDMDTISAIEKFDAKALYAESANRGHELMCGRGAVCAAMLASEMLGANKVETLKYANSGDTAGDKRKVVGYLSAAIVESGENEETNMLNETQRKKILKLARETILHYLNTGERLAFVEDDSVLNKEMGAFVTLHKRGQLRGCIGNMIGRGPLYLTVREMAISAATGDPRFSKVTPEEMEVIDIEISVLSPLEKIDDPDKIEVGKHGVIVRNAVTNGVYLPQVATETGWNREQFMNSLCGQKAGMAADAWKTGNCDIYIFTAEVFGENN